MSSDDAHAMFGKSIAAADWHSNRRKASGSTEPKSDESRTFRTKSSPLAQASSVVCRHAFHH
ncbi:hypothetical protein A2J01_24890 [Rhodococcus sp. EPR-134]|nr:hypothetical protein A2J01_24890 [Rhodococcus sp. EPR-134]